MVSGSSIPKMMWEEESEEREREGGREGGGGWITNQSGSLDTLDTSELLILTYAPSNTWA